MPTSSEFMALCRAQVSLLTQGFGASLSVVYLTQQLVEAEPRLVPILAYPEAALNQEPLSRSLPTTDSWQTTNPLVTDFLATDFLTTDLLVTDGGQMEQSDRSSPEMAETSSFNPDPIALVHQRQLVVPLMHEKVVLGLLVVGRDDRGWSDWEHAQIEQIANTIALACVLDQRYQWLEHDRHQQRLLVDRQHDLLDNLLHQFRNSLTALQTFGKLILKRLLPEDPNREVAASLVRETARLRELAQQLEAATAIQTEPATLTLLAQKTDLPLLPAQNALVGTALVLEPCLVQSVLEPLLTSAVPIAHDRGLKLHTALPTYLPLVQANAQALREVLNNLIENALKYTPADGSIVVQAKLNQARPQPPGIPSINSTSINSTNPHSTAIQSDWVEISISNTGSPIPAQDLPHIFERRYRGVQSQSEIPGSGLGLAIAKNLVEQMQGQISVTSPAQPDDFLPFLDSTIAADLGGGSTFQIKLPIATAQN